MIGVDTNVLVRVVLDDQLEEADAAKQLLQRATAKKQLFVSSYAILEMVWVLKVKGKTRQQITEVILHLLDSPGITIGQRDVVTKALEHFSKGKADFGDYLILAEGSNYHTHRLASFDKALCKENSHCQHPAQVTGSI